MKRTQIYLDDEQDRQLSARARACGQTKSALIRAYIDEGLAKPDDEAARLAEFKAAARAAFGTAPHQAESYAELRENGRRRAEELERRWHGEE